MFVRKMLARALPLTALGLVAWCPAYAELYIRHSRIIRRQLRHMTAE